jgi:hypothetical protein
MIMKKKKTMKISMVVKLQKDDFMESSPLSSPSPTPLASEGEGVKKIDLVLFHVIPAKAGIQCFPALTNLLDPGFHRGDG